jgi:hypothetical protein
MLATHRNGEEEAIPLYLQVSGSEQNVEDAGGRKVEVLLVGMNPGPFGMAQVHLTSIAQDPPRLCPLSYEDRHKTLCDGKGFS